LELGWFCLRPRGSGIPVTAESDRSWPRTQNPPLGGLPRRKFGRLGTLLPAEHIPGPGGTERRSPTGHDPHSTLTPMALPTRYARPGQPVAPLRDILSPAHVTNASAGFPALAPRRSARGPGPSAATLGKHLSDRSRRRQSAHSSQTTQRGQTAAKTKLGLTQRRRGTRRNAEKMKALRISATLSASLR